MRRIMLGFILVLAASPVLAQSNIGLKEYPGPTCAKLQKPVQPGSQQPGLDAGADAVDGYNAKVRQFNKAVADYNQGLTDFNICMKAYVDNGNADMARIKQRVDQAVAQANAN